jgi:hypothetical protein
VADRTRTGSGVINRHLLYHLSYRHRLFSIKNPSV